MLRPDEVADERDQADLPRALEPFGGDDRADLAEAFLGVALTSTYSYSAQWLISSAGAAHPVGDHFVASVPRRAAGARARPSTAAG